MTLNHTTSQIVKACTKCHILKPLTDFWPRTKSRLIQKCQPDPIVRYFRTAIPKGLTTEQMAQELKMRPESVYNALVRAGFLPAYIFSQECEAW